MPSVEKKTRINLLKCSLIYTNSACRVEKRKKKKDAPTAFCISLVQERLQIVML